MTYFIQAIRFFVLLSVLVISYKVIMDDVSLKTCLHYWLLMWLGLTPFLMTTYGCIKLYEVTHGET